MRQDILTPFRQRIGGEAEGRVLEIGIGSGLNLSHYTTKVRAVVGLEPSALLRSKAAERSQNVRMPVDLIEGRAETIPLDDQSIDTVVSTWTLCTISDAALALAEVRRVLKKGGRFLFVEHGLSPDGTVARWQNRLDPMWRCISGGCHLNRKIDDLVANGGLRIDRMSKAQVPGWKTHSFVYEGSASAT